MILPFFVTFLVRTLAWKTILADDGLVVGFFDTLGIPMPDGRILATSWGNVWGLTYNFLPFMVLPIYVSLEKIDLSLLEAANDLYSTSWRGFRKVVLPLSLPGVFAGSLLTFIPAAGDFINQQYLGSANTTDDRHRHPERVPQDQGLPDRGGPVLRADGAHPGGHPGLRPRPRAPRTSCEHHTVSTTVSTAP